MGVLTCRSSGSMGSTDLRPLHNAPSTARISQYNNNRLGSVYSSLHEFWASRQATLNAAGQNVVATCRDAYSMILFQSSPTTCISNDFTRSPDDLLDSIVSYRAGDGSNYTRALAAAQSLMIQHWSDERYAIPVGRSLLATTDMSKVSCSHFPLRWRVHRLRCRCSFSVPGGHRPRVSPDFSSKHTRFNFVQETPFVPHGILWSS